MIALLLLALQESDDVLLRRLAEGRIEEREAAARELTRRGTAALPALKAAAAANDPELAPRAKLVLEKIAFNERLTPGLRAVDGLPERLARAPSEWAAVLAELKSYPTLGHDDWTALAREALKATTEAQVLLRVLNEVRERKLVGALGDVEAKAAHSDPWVRYWVSHSRVALAGSKALEVAEPLLNDKDGPTRDGAAAALGDVKAPGAGARLAKVAEAHGLSDALKTAFWKLRAKEGIPFLEKQCRLPHFDNWMPRSSAAMYLGFYAGPEQIPLFRELLVWMKDEPNSAYPALKHLGTWGDRESIPAIEKAIASFRLWGNCPQAAAQALFHMGAKDSTESLLKLAREGEGRSTALWALGQMGDRRAIEGLREFLDPPDAAALIALGELGDRESVPALRSLLSNKGKSLRQAAATALALLGDEGSRAAIGKLSPEGATARLIWGEGRDTAALGVSKTPYYGGSVYGPQLQYGSSSTHGYLRYISVRAVATSRAAVDVDRVPGLLEDKDQRLYAAAALARLGRKEGVELLLAEERYPAGLNALRRPAAFKALDAKVTTLDLYAPYRQLHERLAAEAGLKLEGPPEGSDARVAWLNVHNRLRKWGRPPSIAEAFELIEDERWSIVLEEDRIRIVPRDDAGRLWSGWARGDEK